MSSVAACHWLVLTVLMCVYVCKTALLSRPCLVTHQRGEEEGGRGDAYTEKKEGEEEEIGIWKTCVVTFSCLHTQ